MRSRIMVIGRDVGQRARLAQLLNARDYRVEIAESAAHACRIGFKGIALAIVAPDGLGPVGQGLLHELRAAVGNVLLVGAPGRKRDRRAELIDVSDEDGVLARVAEALLPAGEPEAPEPVLHFGGYRLDLGGHCLTDRAGRDVPLTHGEFGFVATVCSKTGQGVVAGPVAAPPGWPRCRDLRPQYRHADCSAAPQDRAGP